MRELSVVSSCRPGARDYIRRFRHAVAASNSWHVVVEFAAVDYPNQGNPTRCRRRREPPFCDTADDRRQDRMVSSVAPGPAITVRARGTMSSPQ
jgi:hypothetical protein